MDSSYIPCDGSDCEPTIAQVIGTNDSHHAEWHQRVTPRYVRQGAKTGG